MDTSNSKSILLEQIQELKYINQKLRRENPYKNLDSITKNENKIQSLQKLLDNKEKLSQVLQSVPSVDDLQLGDSPSHHTHVEYVQQNTTTPPQHYPTNHSSLYPVLQQTFIYPQYQTTTPTQHETHSHPIVTTPQSDSNSTLTTTSTPQYIQRSSRITAKHTAQPHSFFSALKRSILHPTATVSKQQQQSSFHNKLSNSEEEEEEEDLDFLSPVLNKGEEQLKQLEIEKQEKEEELQNDLEEISEKQKELDQFQQDLQNVLLQDLSEEEINEEVEQELKQLEKEVSMDDESVKLPSQLHEFEQVFTELIQIWNTRLDLFKEFKKQMIEKLQSTKQLLRLEKHVSQGRITQLFENGSKMITTNTGHIIQSGDMIYEYKYNGNLKMYARHAKQYAKEFSKKYFVFVLLDQQLRIFLKGRKVEKCLPNGFTCSILINNNNEIVRILQYPENSIGGIEREILYPFDKRIHIISRVKQQE